MAKTPGLWINGNKRKQNSVNIDTLSTTHPIVKYTPHTDSAEDLLNAITYGKGLAFLKQLVYIIGKDVLSDACKLYFQKYKWGNTTLDDFMSCLEEKALENPNLMGIDTKGLCLDFLLSKGINNLKTRIEEDVDGIDVVFQLSRSNNASKIISQ